LFPGILAKVMQKVFSNKKLELKRRGVKKYICKKKFKMFK